METLAIVVEWKGEVPLLDVRASGPRAFGASPMQGTCL